MWFNYTGKYTGTGTPALNDPKWHALPAQPGGEHDLALRGFDKPYNPGADKGKGDWFVWKDLGTTCPRPDLPQHQAARPLRRGGLFSCGPGPAA